MGSYHSSQSRTSSSDGLDNSFASSRVRKSRRLMEKFRGRQSSKSDLIAQTDGAIDPIEELQVAQNPGEGETQNRERTTADVDQIEIKLRDDEESVRNNNNEPDATTQSNLKPVSEDRHVITCEATHTAELVERESTKHNTAKAISCNSTATDERSQQKLRESCDKSSFSDQFDSKQDFQVVYETESWRTAKNWKSTATRTDQGGETRGNVIVIREAQTSSSSESIFTDPDSPFDEQKILNLVVLKLKELNLVSTQSNLKKVYNESVNLIGDGEFSDEMPIKNKTSQNGQNSENGTDKGIFSVSRVKKVELAEIPLASDICATPPPEQQTVTTQTPTNTVKTPGNGNSSNNKTPNGSGKVLHRVITLTTANLGDQNLSGKTTKPSPAYVPEKLHFSAYEKFEGQMLMNWFAQSLQSIAGSMTSSLNENDLSTLTLQYCSNLLIAGVIRQLDASSQSSTETFNPNSMYQWTHKEPTTSSTMTPGRLETAVVWPHTNDKKTSPKSREGESKIPKLLSASTPKARIQLVTSLVTMSEHSPLTLLNGTETDHNKVNELKTKMTKCETIQEMFALIKSFLSEYSMQSSESSSNSGVFSGSILNGSDSTVYDRSLETTVFNVLQHRTPDSSPSKVQTTPKSRTVKSRTSPSTPTGTTSRNDPKRIRRNLSVDSVNNASKINEAVNGVVTKRTGQLMSPGKLATKRMVDKATVMDVEPMELLKASETRTIETQTEPEIEDKDEVKKMETKIVSAPIPPPPPPMMMNIPPPPPPCPGPPPIPGPPPPPMFNMGSSIPPPPNLPTLGGPMPLPPPIALNSGPGKLQCQMSSNVTSSSAAANGSKPKPLPLIPASELYLTNTLRKNAVNPPKPMKPLYWTRIVAPIKSFDSVDGVQSAISTPEEKSDNGEEEELWKEIDETKLDNLDEFTELFSRQGVVPKAKTATPLPKIKAIKVLDDKRSQNVGIFVRSIHVDFAEIEHAIYYCDTSVVSLETLQHIMEIKATKEELMMIEEAVAAHTEGSPPLDAPEHFLLRISQVSSSAERISCIVFQAEFEEQCTMVSRKLELMKSLCEFLLENEGLKEVFSIILTLGNFMNGGNRQRGQADGFGLEILGKLKDVKSKDPKITLLHFIVKTYIERCRKSGCAIADLVLPIPDPNDVDKSLSIDFEECKAQLNALKSKVEECRKTTEKVISESDEVQPFKEKMEAFIEKANKKIDRRFSALEECHLLFVKTIRFYMFIPKKGTLEETAPAQFFEYWTSFTSDFNAIFKKEIQLLTNELMKKTRQVTKPQSKPTSGENNLKARINRLKNRNN